MMMIIVLWIICFTVCVHMSYAVAILFVYQDHVRIECFMHCIIAQSGGSMAS